MHEINTLQTELNGSPPGHPAHSLPTTADLDAYNLDGISLDQLEALVAEQAVAEALTLDPTEFGSDTQVGLFH